MRYLTVKKFSSESGYTEAAIRAKMADGTWLKDYVWLKAPHGRVLIDIDGYEAWVEAGKQLRSPRGSKFRSVKSQKPVMSLGPDLGSPTPLV